jgi:uncharacterized protein
MARLTWQGLELELKPERAVWVPAAGTVLVADLHLGKPAAFRRAGVPVPEQVTDADLARLDRVLRETGAKRLVILGDLLHARAGRNEWTHGLVRAWRSAWPALEIDLVRGNHDRSAGDPPGEWGMRVMDGPWWDERVGAWLSHEPDGQPGEELLGGSSGAGEASGTSEPRPMFAGHLHPGVVMEPRRAGRAKCVGGRARAACFWFGERVAVLPAYGSFTGCAAVRPGVGDRVFAIGPGEIAEIPVVVSGPGEKMGLI